MRPTRPFDPPLQVIELSKGPLAFTDTGSGRPLVAVHGMPGTHRDFRWLDSALAGRLRCIRLDLPGFGCSPVAGHQDHTVQGMARAVGELCELASLEDAIVLGHSMGGPIAVEAAAQSPRIGALALVNSAGPLLHRGIFPTAYRVLLRLVDLHPVSRWLTLTIMRPVARAVGFSRHFSDAELIRATRLCAEYQPSLLEASLSRLAKPVLISWAEDDPAVELKVSQALVACAPDPQCLPFSAGRHNLQATLAVELAAALVTWAESL